MKRACYFMLNDDLYKLEFGFDEGLAKLREQLKKIEALNNDIEFSLFYKCEWLKKTIYRIDDDQDLNEAAEMMKDGTIFFLISLNALILEESFVFPSFPIFQKPIILNSNTSIINNNNVNILNNKVTKKKKIQTSNNKWDEIVCIFCSKNGDGKEGEGELFELPIKKRKLFAHRYCALSVPGIYFSEKEGTLNSSSINKCLNSKAFSEFKCSYSACKLTGAMLTCPIDKCYSIVDGEKQCTTYHFSCAFESGCGLGDNYQFYCKEHVDHLTAIKVNVLVPKRIKEWVHLLDYEEDNQLYKCAICREYSTGDMLIECDSCGKKEENFMIGYHLCCLNLTSMPKGKWDCPRCEEKKKERKSSLKQTTRLVSSTSFIYKEETYNVNDYVFLILPRGGGKYKNQIGKISRIKASKSSCGVKIKIIWLYRFSEVGIANLKQRGTKELLLGVGDDSISPWLEVTCIISKCSVNIKDNDYYYNKLYNPTTAEVTNLNEEQENGEVEEIDIDENNMNDNLENEGKSREEFNDMMETEENEDKQVKGSSSTLLQAAMVEMDVVALIE